MKRIYQNSPHKWLANISGLLLLALIGLSSCNEYLDADPEMGIDNEKVYEEYYNYKDLVERGNWLVRNHVGVNTDWGSFNGSLSDEQQQVELTWPPCNSANKGLIMDSNWRDFGLNFDKDNETKSGAGTYYTAPAGKSINAIRAMCLAINNIDKLVDFPAEEGDPATLKNELLGQAYVLRAWHQFEVICRYGPMVLFDVETGEEFPVDYDFDKARPTFQACADIIAADCDEAIKYLPARWEGVNIGRLTQTSARAIKAKALMWAASPLTNTGEGSFPDGVEFPYGQDSYNMEYAQKALTAWGETLKGMAGTRYVMYSKDDYMKNWTRKGSAISDEAIFEPGPSNLNGWSMPIGWKHGQGWYLPHFDGGWKGYLVPTQNAVDHFETKNGYPVTDFTSDDPTFLATDPYNNRDPRLRMTIFCPGDPMYLSGKVNEAWSNADDEGTHYKFAKGKGTLFSGYFNAGKYRQFGSNSVDKQGGYYRSYPLIRIPDVYLGIAELGNELYGPTTAIPEIAGSGINTAEEAINMVRQRVDMPGVLAEFLNKEDFKMRVYNEYAVEFYDEFRRWFDLRRWRMSKSEFAKGMKGVVVTKKPDGSFTYQSAPLSGSERVFEDKHYWYPFPTVEIDKFEIFKQNPGW